jgi:enoyl-CoA hydratase/carnithine racemase
MSSPEPMISYRVAEGIGRLTLQRPDKLNALHRGFWEELGAVMASVRSDDAVRCVVIDAVGRAFSVGGDIATFQRLQSTDERRSFLTNAFGRFEELASLPVPTIAAVQGYAFGGGCELAMACDVVVADETAVFSTPEGRIGIVPGVALAMGHTVVPPRALNLLTLVGGRIDARAALVAGLVNEVVGAGDHVDAALRIAIDVCQSTPAATRAAKALLVAARPPASYARAVDAVVALLEDEDHRARSAAFLAGG